MKKLTALLLCASLMVRANDIENPSKKEAREVVDLLCEPEEGIDRMASPTLSDCSYLYLLINGTAREYAYSYQHVDSEEEIDYFLRKIFKHKWDFERNSVGKVVRKKVKILAKQKNIDKDTQLKMINAIEKNLKDQGLQLDKNITRQEQLKKERKSKGI